MAHDACKPQVSVGRPVLSFEDSDDVDQKAGSRRNIDLASTVCNPCNWMELPMPITRAHCEMVLTSLVEIIS